MTTLWPWNLAASDFHMRTRDGTLLALQNQKSGAVQLKKNKKKKIFETKSEMPQPASTLKTVAVERKTHTGSWQYFLYVRI